MDDKTSTTHLLRRGAVGANRNGPLGAYNRFSAGAMTSSKGGLPAPAGVAPARCQGQALILLSGKSKSYWIENVPHIGPFYHKNYVKNDRSPIPPKVRIPSQL